HTRQERQIEFFETRDGETIEFNPAMVLHTVGEKDGTVTTFSAAGSKGTISHVTRTFVGTDQMSVGKEDIEAVYVHIETVMTGRSRGTSDDQMWLRPSDGAILKYERHVDTYSKAFGADVRYLEDVTFELESLSPQR
ncbi:MAG: hypothetical protein WD826_06460, partial [Actinomycetota bacterium]